MRGVTEKELGRLRKDTFVSVSANIVKNYRHENQNGQVAVDHQGIIVRLGGYPGVKLNKVEPVSFGF